ncbi:MAG: endonuclease/exonuclease/phosphatase family protein [Pricia sp.]
MLLILNIILAVFIYDFDDWWHFIILAALVLSLLYQCYLIFPYTILSKVQVLKYGGAPNEDTLSILVSNVLTPNREYQKIIDLVDSKNPDILLTLESDEVWENALSVLDNVYEYRKKVPLDNLYGMHLFSKLPLENIEVKFLIADDIPSIHGYVRLKNGKRAKIHCLHPRPPSPSESKTSTNRDAELLLVGREINQDAERVLVFGDLNDVAWSRTTRLFQKLSGLLDPRKGRAFFNTFSAEYKLLRWPLDHVFHTKDFTLIDISREKEIGSDHFPMYIKLNYTPKAEWKQKSLSSEKSEEDWADEKIEKAEPKVDSL